ncbi:MAG: C40 family peptidase [Chitinophagales bacterium]|nr:C40 family peptidase [Chitinophagales bacterium]
MYQFGIVTLSNVAIRAEDSHQSEQITEALFGETFKILEYTNDWSRIQLAQDGYIGWIQNGQWNAIQNINDKHFRYNISLLSSVKFNNKTTKILIGARVWDNNIQDEFLSQFHFNKQIKTISFSKQNFTNNIISTAKKFLGTPYHWGGKTQFGIDCSGLTQLVFQVNGIQLPRDAYQQAEKGQQIHWQDVQKGDLVFFTQGSEKITHVGIIYSTSKKQVKVIHASKYVKIDILDEKGILVQEGNRENQYSHQLKLIKRMLE